MLWKLIEAVGAIRRYGSRARFLTLGFDETLE